MTDLHALFGLAPSRARESARLRVLANNVVDGITSRRSRDVAGDWRAWRATCRTAVPSAPHGGGCDRPPTATASTQPAA